MIGRKKEFEKLNDLYNSNKSQFIAIYGRRRVGKTYLVNETFKDKITFRHAGLSPIESDSDKSLSPLKKQLKHFYNSLLLHGMKKSSCPENWMEAFFMLEVFLQGKDDGSRQVVFIDELPWLDTPKSGFITAFEGFWNTWACTRSNFMLIVCGSATSWMTDKLINNHGGLYGRLTYEIKLSPFMLGECEAFFKENNIRLSRYDIVQAYMITGGIPYYLNFFQKGLSLAQNIDDMFFSTGAQLKGEFVRLFNSIFNNADLMMSIIHILDGSSYGFTRDELSEKTGLKTGGTLTNALNALIAGDFIVKYVPFGIKGKPEYYKLVDPFCIFYMKFIEDRGSIDSEFWRSNISSQSIVSWRGIAFENVCFNHIKQIKNALGISGVSSSQSAWSKREGDSSGTQIDMLIDRKDNVLNMCEMKFFGDKFRIDKSYDAVLRHRENLLFQMISPKTIIHSTLITTFGLEYNEYSGDFTNVIDMDALFMMI